MKIKNALMSGLFLMGALTASAQDQQPKTEYVSNPYWYLQIQAGGQYTLGSATCCLRTCSWQSDASSTPLLVCAWP